MSVHYGGLWTVCKGSPPRIGLPGREPQATAALRTKARKGGVPGRKQDGGDALARAAGVFRQAGMVPAAFRAWNAWPVTASPLLWACPVTVLPFPLVAAGTARGRKLW